MQHRSGRTAIYELRKARGLTQHQLAALVGTKQPAIARLEDADYNGHTLGMLSRIAEALGCSVSVSFVPRKLPGLALGHAGDDSLDRAQLASDNGSRSGTRWGERSARLRSTHSRRRVRLADAIPRERRERS